MSIVIGIAFLLVALLNARYARSLLYPPAIFSAYWAILLIGCGLSGDALYTLSPQVLTIYSLGIAFFSIGGAVGLVATSKSRHSSEMSEHRQTFVHRLLVLGLFGMVLVLPFYIRHLQYLSSISGVSDFWIGLRYQTSVVANEGFGAYAYAGPLATFLAMAAYYERRMRRCSAWLPLGLGTIAVAFHVMTMSRTGVLLLLCGLVGVGWMASGKVRAGTSVLGAASAVAAFSFAAVLLGKGADANASVTANVGMLWDTIRLYMFGGVVAFDQYVQGFVQLELGVRTLRFYALIANAFGGEFQIPSLVQGYARTPEPTNVYTMFMPYYADFGWVGVAVTTCLLGFASSCIYAGARRGTPVFVILYGFLFGSIVLSLANDTFFTATSYWLQILIYAFLFYRAPIILMPRGVGTDSSRPRRPGERHLAAQSRLHPSAHYRGQAR
jgi:oligosaccharide repeat unit polymerase